MRPAPTRARWPRLVLALLCSQPLAAAAQTTQDAPAGRPEAIVDLDSAAGLDLMRAQWRFSEARIVEVDHRAPGPDLKPSGPPNRTHDVEPKAGAAGFDDSGWQALEPGTLAARRASGRLCFAWYRTELTVPKRVGSFDTAGSTAIFEIVVDDYAEVWVDGGLPLVLGQPGGPLAGGYNSPNRVVLGRDLQPGQKIHIAVFAMNGPLSSPPGNFIWIRSATVEFHRPGGAAGAQPVRGEVVRVDPGLDALVPAAPRFEKLASGFLFIEGPVWAPEGHLLFSDPNANRIYRYAGDGQVSVYRTRSGYTGVDVGEYNQPGSNGLALDPEGRLTICEHGNRRITRLEKNGTLTVLAERHEGKRLNSPNDLVYRSDGALYFTDPPFGLPKFFDDPRKELPYSGVFLLRDGALRLVSSDLSGPNGLAFSPDERYLYVDNWDVGRKVVMRYEVAADGGLSNGSVFFDMTREPGEQALDGLKVDRRGNLYVSGPGGIWVISAAGKHLGTLRFPELPANFAWGDEDRRALYVTARTGLYRVRLEVGGAHP